MAGGVGVLVEGTLFAAGLVLTVVVGAPLASRAATADGAWSWLRRPNRDTPERPRVEMTRAFTPLDLGPDPIQWPSQRPWPASPIAAPLWPSQTWDDEHFGSHWRKKGQGQGQGQGAVPAAAGDAEARFFRQEAGEVPVAGPAPTAEPPARTAAKPAAKPAPKQQRPSQAKPVQAPASRPAAPAAPQAAKGTPPRGNDIPTREELEAMVAQIGLAGTVQRIMERTGWDFRQAAQYLARIRQGA